MSRMTTDARKSGYYSAEQDRAVEYKRTVVQAGVMITISPLPSPMKGAAILTEDQSKALLSGNMYINVRTAKYPDGEIRGQLTPAS